MAFKFESEPQQFLTQWRNGTNFDTVETEYTNRVRGNYGGLVQVRQTITVECSVNETLSLPFTYDSTNEKLVSEGLDFLSEGIFIGATIQVIQGVNSGESTVVNITGPGFNTVFLDITNLAFLTDGEHYDIYIRVKDAPTYMRYMYGLIPSDERTDSLNRYASPLDGNVQAYYKYDIVTPSFEYLEMERFGVFKSWDMTRDLNVAFVQTTNDYYHEYSIIHTFRLPTYREEESTNIIKQIPPAEVANTKTLKYANKIELGYSSEVTGEVTNLGVTGDVGYYGENYNGKRNIFTVASMTITNNSGDGELSAGETNTITAKLTNTANAFYAAQKIIVSVFKCARQSEYANNKTDTWEEAFVFDSVSQTAGRPAETSSQIRNVVITYNDPTDVDIDFQVVLSTDQQDKISNGDMYAILFETGENGKDPDVENNATMVEVGLFYAGADLENLITNVNFQYADSYAALSGDRIFTNQATWDGCFVGFEIDFRLVQYTDGSYSRITSIISRLILVSDADPDDVHELWVKPLPLAPSPPINVYDDGTYIYQLIAASSNDTDKLPTGEPLNFNQVRSLPAFPAGYQVVTIQGSIPRIPWRDWIENNQIPNVFYDPDFPNNNLSQKTSNYSGLNGYSVRHEILISVDYSFLVPTDISKPNVETITTPYHLRSDIFEVLDFDEDGNPSIVFNGEINIYNELSVEVNVLSSTIPYLIEVVITHDQGTLTLSDLWGEIWIEPVGATGEVWQLHSSKDFSHNNNPLTGSQEVSAVNLKYVEIKSELNVVYLYCATNPAAIVPGAEYNIYYRLGKKTL